VLGAAPEDGVTGPARLQQSQASRGRDGSRLDE